MGDRRPEDLALVDELIADSAGEWDRQGVLPLEVFAQARCGRSAVCPGRCGARRARQDRPGQRRTHRAHRQPLWVGAQRDDLAWHYLVDDPTSRGPRTAGGVPAEASGRRTRGGGVRRAPRRQRPPRDQHEHSSGWRQCGRRRREGVGHRCPLRRSDRGVRSVRGRCRRRSRAGQDARPDHHRDPRPDGLPRGRPRRPLTRLCPVAVQKCARRRRPVAANTGDIGTRLWPDVRRMGVRRHPARVSRGGASTRRYPPSVRQATGRTSARRPTAGRTADREQVSTRVCEHASRCWDTRSPDSVTATVLAKHVSAGHAASGETRLRRDVRRAVCCQ